MVRDGVPHRFEPARDAAVQRIEVAALIVRLVGLAPDRPGPDRERRESAFAVASAIGHVAVGPEVVPAGLEAAPILEPVTLQQRPRID